MIGEVTSLIARLAATFAETFVLSIPALLLLTRLFQTGTLKASDSPARELLWLSLSGLVTTVPLLAFTEAAKRLPLIYLGMLQFISPTAQFLLGVFVYQEPFQSDRWISFGLIWSALAVFLIDLWRRAKSEKRSGKPSLYAQRQRASELAPK